MKYKGYSILEAILAVIILSTAATGILSSIKLSSRAFHHCRLQAKASLLAERLLVEEKISGLNEYTNRTGSEDRFQWQVNIKKTTIEEFARIEIAVYWLEQGIRRNFELVSFSPMETFVQEN